MRLIFCGIGIDPLIDGLVRELIDKNVAVKLEEKDHIRRLEGHKNDTGVVVKPLTERTFFTIEKKSVLTGETQPS